MSSVQEGNWLSLLIGLAASSASRFGFGSRVDFCCSQICMAKQIADVYKINTSLEQMLGGWLLSAYVIIDTAEKEAAFHSLVKRK